MPKFRKKPVVIEAKQFLGVNLGNIDAAIDFEEWLEKHQDKLNRVAFRYQGTNLLIPTLEGMMMAIPGDWIIKGIAGEFYPCKPDIFAATYEPAEDA